MNSIKRSAQLFAVNIYQRASTRCLAESFSPKNAVILSKLTRFEYERIRNHDLDEDELRTCVRHYFLSGD